MRNDTIIMDSLYNATTACTGNDPAKQTYGHGVLVGLVSGIMGQGKTFGQAITFLADIRKRASWYANEREIDIACVPVCWRDDFRTQCIL